MAADSGFPVEGLVPIEQMVGDDAEDTALLRGMAQDAAAYLLGHPWCSSADCRYFAGGVGGVLAVFLFRIDSPRADVPTWLWAIVGDLPPAYLPLEDAATPGAAFRLYIDGMTRWVELARIGKTGNTDDGVPPVNLPSTPEWADNLERRLHLLLLLVKPRFDPSGESQEIN